MPEAGFTIMPEGDLARAASGSSMRLEKKGRKCRAFVVGPGLGDDEYALDLMSTLLGQTERASLSSLGFGVPATPARGCQRAPFASAYNRPILIDADGLNALARSMTGGPRSGGLAGPSPHVGEFGRLMDVISRGGPGRPEGAGSRRGQSLRQMVLLKGAPTIVTDGRLVFRAAEAPPRLPTGREWRCLCPA